MTAQHVLDLAESGQWMARAACKGIGQVSKEPRPTEAPPADDYAIDVGLAHHLQRVGCLPDVAIAQHRNGDMRLERRNCVPVRFARVRLLCGPAMQRYRRAARVLGDPAGIEESLMIVVDADPGLDRHRYTVWCRGLDSGFQDHLKPVALVRQRGTAALARHPRNWATEVQVDMTDAVLIAQNLCGMRHDHWVHAVQLH